MGLDVYVGTLTRYYAGEWETVVQQVARELGIPVQIERVNETPDAIRDPLQIEELIVVWRDRLSASLGAHLERPLVWSEGLAAPYFTDKPAWDCYAALLIWAVHADHPDIELPSVVPDEWRSHAAVARIQSKDFQTGYGQLLRDTELWLPGDFTFTFRSEDPTGAMVGIGSVTALAAQLRELNERTWRADATTLQEWRQAGAEHGAPFEASAQFGFAVLSELAERAAEYDLPIKLDY